MKVFNKNIKLKIWIPIIVILLCLVGVWSSLKIQYNNAAKTAENHVAIYLAKNYSAKTTGKNIDSLSYYNENRIKNFRSFDEIYSSTKVEDFKYVVELSGSANCGSSKFPFYTKVKITPFTNNITIEELYFCEEKIK